MNECFNGISEFRDIVKQQEYELEQRHDPYNAKLYNDMKPGDLAVDTNGILWLKPVQVDNHLEGLLISLDDGTVYHYSRLNCLVSFDKTLL